MVFRSTRLDRNFGRLALVPREAPATPGISPLFAAIGSTSKAAVVSAS